MTGTNRTVPFRDEIHTVGCMYPTWRIPIAG